MNFYTIWGRVKSKLFGGNALKKAYIASPFVTDDMAHMISTWSDMYENKSPWLTKTFHSLSLPSAMAQEMARLVTLEMDATVSDPTISSDEDDQNEAIEQKNAIPGVNEPNARVQLIAHVFKNVMDNIEINVEYACALGGLVFKPYVDGNTIVVDYVHADDFYPVSFNSRGEITAAMFLEHKKDKNKFYTRVERHEISGVGYVITNMAYVSNSDNDIGTAASLKDVEEWADIEPMVTIENIDFPLFAYFKIPLGNIIDRRSQLGVSIFARALRAGLIRDADEQWDRFMWEYDGGELAVDASADAFKRVKGPGGKEMIPVLPKGKERLFRVNEIPVSSNGSSDARKLLDVYAPVLRDTSYANGLNEILMRIEDTSGFARGTFSNLNTTERTATELIHSKQRSYATVSSIQKSLEKALDKLARAVDALATLYELTIPGEYAISYTWDDSIVVDADSEREKDRMDVNDGLMMKWEYRVKWYGETKAQALKILNDGKSRSDDELMDFRRRYFDEPSSGDEVM